MLESLHLKNVGPAPEMRMDLAPRLNLITGDNGLGKSFLLDVAWWALTRKWPQDLNANLTSGYAARPTDVTKKATIDFELESKTQRVKYESPYVPEEQAWKGKAGRPWNPGLVIYALADGGFAVWDPARNYWRKQGNIDVQERLAAYVFSSKEVWDGLTVSIEGKPTQASNGLVADWASWIRERGADAKRMAGVLELLAPNVGDDSLKPGDSFARLSINDARDIPTVRMGYSQDVPILYVSLGVRRITALAYMLSWAWREHRIASRQLGQTPSSRVVMLFDEIEAHLHPRWQRAVVPSLLKVMQTLTEDAGASVQLIAATHSPLVLASVEPLFDVKQDAWFDLDLEGQKVELRKRPYVRLGEVGNWLTSEAFDLAEPRSLEGERAVCAAQDVLNAKSPLLTEIEAADKLLREAGLPDIDPFWVRRDFFVERARKTNALHRPPCTEPRRLSV
jgi:AAA domain, putative AbiEii toxin, Type IV TA system